MQAAIKAAGVQRNSSLKNKHTLAVPLSVCETRRASNSSPPPPPLPITQYDDEVFSTGLRSYNTGQKSSLARLLFLGREEEIWGNSIACLCPGRLRLRQSTFDKRKRGKAGARLLPPLPTLTRGKREEAALLLQLFLPFSRCGTFNASFRLETRA